MTTFMCLHCLIQSNLTYKLMQQTLYMYDLDNYRRILGYGSLINSKNLDCVAVTRVLEMKLTFFFLKLRNAHM